ncbi:MAG TPA: fibronectin type III domain-containing protein, partial [Thermoanaerobaculia bacterium]|nr:fibronectin type III domain-containing protein [Thermoanaerobaculia bacterium]
GSLVGRILDWRGDPVSETFTLRDDGYTPRLAFDGTNVTVIYQNSMPMGWQVFSLRLRPAPVPVELANPQFLTFAPEKAHLDIASNGAGLAAVVATDRETKITLLAKSGDIVRQVVGPGGGNAAIATNGSDYLAVTAYDHFLEGTVIRANGTVEPPVAYSVTGEEVSGPSVVWANNAYQVAFLSKTGSATTARTATIEPDTKKIEEDEDSFPALPVSRTSIAAVGTNVMTTWQWADDSIAIVRPVTEGEDDPDAVAWGAAEQTLGGATSSPAGMFLTWSELDEGVLTFHTGIRAHNGRWTEHQVSLNALPTHVATDGNEFMGLTFMHGEGFRTVSFGADGRVRGTSAPVAARQVHDLVWNGTHYAVAYVDAQGQATVARVSTSGAVSSPVIVSFTGTSGYEVPFMSLASDGTNLIAVWQRERSEVCFPVCDVTQEWIEAVRFGPELQRLDLAAVAISGNDSYQPRAIWDGSNFLVVWHTRTEVVAATLGRTSGGPSNVFTVSASTTESTRDLELARFAGGVAVTWRRADRDSLLIRNGNQVTAFDAPFDLRTLVAMPDGSGMFLGTSRNNGAPHHGARRIFMRYAGVVHPGTVPAAPSNVTIRRFQSNQFRIEWDAPPQPVDGYRVEYKVGDGQWLELSRWFDPDERIAPWPGVRPATAYSFRVRAWSKAGTSEYATVGTFTGKRRAVN